MEEPKYKVLFKGEIAADADVEMVKGNVAALYNVDVKKVDHLFSGKMFTLQDGVSLERAAKFMSRFEKAGARCSLVKKETARPAQTAAAKKESHGPNKENIPMMYETCFRVIYRGEIVPGKDLSEVKTRLSIFYKVKPERIESLFTRKPVVVKDRADFVSAIEFMKRFNEFGAVCHIEPVGPPKSEAGKAAPAPIAPTAQIAVPTPLPKTTAAAPELETVKPAPTSPVPGDQSVLAASEELYKRFTAAFRQVKSEFNIEKKIKQFDQNETTLGCMMLIIIAAAVIMVITTPLRWYWAVGGGVLGIVLLSLLSKPWNLKYADYFMKRMEAEKQKDATLFAVTLKKWVGDLPQKDKAKIHLQTIAVEIFNERSGQDLNIREYTRVIIPDEPAAPGGGEPSAAPGPAIPKINAICPKCGSNWITEDVRGFGWGRGIAASLFLGPLGGAIVGSTAEGKRIYVCQNCGKKWNRK